MSGKAFCIVGMVRSGTSLLAGAVRQGGVYFGQEKDLMPPLDVINGEGFFEHLRIVNLHQRLLLHFGSAWYLSTPLPREWWRQPEIAPFREELRQLIATEFGASPCWGWKDPRGIFMLPLWLDLLAEMGIEARVIIPFRNPLAVARSTARLWNLSRRQSLRLWFHAMLSLQDAVRQTPHLFIEYDEFLEAPEIQGRRLQEFIGEGTAAGMVETIRHSLRPELRHGRSDPGELQAVAGADINRLYQECRGQNPPDGGVIRTLDEYRQFAMLADFGECDYIPLLLHSSLICAGGGQDSRKIQLIPFKADNSFDETYPLPGAIPGMVLFHPCGNLPVRCRIDSVEIDGKPGSALSRNPKCIVKDGWGIFSPDTGAPSYEILGDFSGATTLRIRGRIEVSQPPYGEFRRQWQPQWLTIPGKDQQAGASSGK